MEGEKHQKTPKCDIFQKSDPYRARTSLSKYHITLEIGDTLLNYLVPEYWNFSKRFTKATNASNNAITMSSNPQDDKNVC